MVKALFLPYLGFDSVDFAHFESDCDYLPEQKKNTKSDEIYFKTTLCSLLGGVARFALTPWNLNSDPVTRF